MPLTIAHPAIVIPIRHRLVLSALVIGSMVPDFSKVLSLSGGVTLGHSVPGVFWFCVPLGLICFTFFQHLLKAPLFLLLPANHQTRLVPWFNAFPLRTAAQWGLVITSLIIGALTHLFWDSFTHERGWFVKVLPFLQNNLFTIRRHTFQTYECLQYTSTIAGLTFLAGSYIRFYQKASIHPLPSVPLIPGKVKFVLGCFIIMAPVVSGIIFANAHDYPRISWETFARRFVVASMASFCFELILLGILWFRVGLLFRTRKSPAPNAK